MANKYINASARSLSREELIRGVKTLSKTANQRLLRLERAGIDQSSQAYLYVQRSVEKGEKYASVNKKGQVRFVTQSSMSDKELRTEFEKLQGFLGTKTSRVAEAKKIIKKSQEEIAKISGSNLKAEDIGSLWSEPLIEKYFKMYGYTEFNRITNAVENLGLSPSEISKALEAAGFNEDSTDDTKPSLKEIEEKFKKWKELQSQEQSEYPTLSLPDEV